MPEEDGTVDLMEYQAKELFKDAEIPIQRGFTLSAPEEMAAIEKDLSYPLVVKAQVQTGGRGKAGGIRFAENSEELHTAVHAILGMNIKGHTVKKVMLAEKTEVRRELYLSILLDRDKKKHIVIFSPNGGMDIEQTAKKSPKIIYKVEIDPFLGLKSGDAFYLANKGGLTPEQAKQFWDILKKLYDLCKSHSLLLAEINPLALDAQGRLIALDAKITVDDAAIPRLPKIAGMKAAEDVPPLVAEAAQYNFLYIPCEEKGDIVVMSNGSGMLMSCIDHITKEGMAVCAVLDLGGGATADRICHAVRILFSSEKARIMFINIFGGITRCDEVAEGIRLAVKEFGITKPIVTRFEGTNKEKGLAIISNLANVVYADNLLSGVNKIKRRGGK